MCRLREGGGRGAAFHRNEKQMERWFLGFKQELLIQKVSSIKYRGLWTNQIRGNCNPFIPELLL